MIFTSLSKLTPRVNVVKDEGGVIDITFADQRLERDCESDKLGRRRFGDLWPVLQRRLAVLGASPTLAGMAEAPGRCHELHGDRQGRLAVRLDGNTRLVFRPDHEPVPTRDDGGLVWEQVLSIVIEEVVDYHGS
ncbi:hypothetical protein acdb102_15950 [Acidothermaceae bacterium B102]|nr:hypothetical protein acdb102_15950 [Acidothermaceae bacterium B102]